MSTHVRNSIVALSVFIASTSTVWAATSAVKYFQRIKQTTYIGTVSATVTAGDESTKTLERVPQDTCTTRSTVCSPYYQDTEYYREYTVNISGVPGINTDTDPPTFYVDEKYFLNGQRVRLLEEEDGTRLYRYKTVRVHTFADEHTSEETLRGQRLPTTGTRAYTYKIVTLQAK